MANSSGKPWTAADIPDLSGKTIIVTGGNSGIGYEAALELARKHATAIVACRNLDKGKAAAGRIMAAAPGASVEVMQLDLASLASVRAFAEEFHRRYKKLDVLCNNAGVMGIPYSRTADGFEMQIGTNHFGHFALTGLLLDLLLATKGARVVTVASNAHRMAKIHFDDINSERGYGRWHAYGQSKLANLLFTFELQRRIDDAGQDLISVACHPGYAATNLQGASARSAGALAFVFEAFAGVANNLLAQSAAMGALPTLYAATAPDVEGADYLGPEGLANMWGYPAKVGCTAAAQDPYDAEKLWEISERLTGVHYEALGKPATAASVPA